MPEREHIMSIRKSFVFSAVGALLTLGSIAARADAQLQLSMDPLQVGVEFEARVAGAGSSREYFIAADTVPGPTVIQDLGGLVVGLGVSSNFFAFPHQFADANGDGSMHFAIVFDPAFAGYEGYTQAFSFDPTDPFTIVASNVVRTAVHPASAGPGVVSTLTLDPDGSALVSLPFGFDFFGTTYTEVFVNANGHLTFVQADDTAIFDDPAFLGSGPRIAMLATNLDPAAAGTVFVDHTAIAPLAISFVFANVPDVDSGLLNSFSVTLFSGGHIQMAFGDCNPAQAAIGITAGLGVPAAASDLNAGGVHGYAFSDSVFQVFDSGSDFDLDNELLTFGLVAGAGYLVIN